MNDPMDDDVAPIMELDATDTHGNEYTVHVALPLAARRTLMRMYDAFTKAAATNDDLHYLEFWDHTAVYRNKTNVCMAPGELVKVSAPTVRVAGRVFSWQAYDKHTDTPTAITTRGVKLFFQRDMPNSDAPAHSFEEFVTKAAWSDSTQAGVLFEFINGAGHKDNLDRWLSSQYGHELDDNTQPDE